ncbi:hypothetical protein ACFQ6U_13610 [Streptomyces sp. NPDC056465]|uniref:hypothetical protein n=1 Tax=unclassified Streptomyces TaxID=2593676 RepID=UPI0035DDBDAA
MSTEIEPTSALMIVTCRTPDCLYENEPFQVRMYPNAGEPVWAATCAGCSSLVSDIVPATP